MANAKRDSNRIPVLLGALSTDGITPTMVKANPTTHVLSASDGSGGTDKGTANAQRDGNRTPILMAISNVDKITPVEIYADSSGNLLVKST